MSRKRQGRFPSFSRFPVCEISAHALHVMQFLGCLAEYAVVPATSAVVIDESFPFDKAVIVF